MHFLFTSGGEFQSHASSAIYGMHAWMNQQKRMMSI